MKKNKNAVGSSFDDFLKEEGDYETAQALAVKRVLAWQIQKAMKEKHYDQLVKILKVPK